MKILVAMSGGVDSSVTAEILRADGHEVIGAMMKLFSDEALGEMPAASRACCTLSDADDARAVADLLGIPFYVFNFADAFAQDVTARFVADYQRGATPNPCIDCNRYMKFEKFLTRARELDCDAIATGHYARIEQDTSGRYLLKTGHDAAKDQSYFLYTMTQEQLARTLFPLGGLEKDEVRAIATRRNLATAKKRDSQDICFAPDGDYAAFITRHTGKPPQTGNFINAAGEILGRHRGIIHYTVGQRKGLGISAPHPLYVTAINPTTNTITLGANSALFAKSLTATNINLIACEKITTPTACQAKIRYAHKPQPAKIAQTASNQIHAEFAAPERAITPGQAVVFYDGETVIGGGTIVDGITSSRTPFVVTSPNINKNI